MSGMSGKAIGRGLSRRMPESAGMRTFVVALGLLGIIAAALQLKQLGWSRAAVEPPRLSLWWLSVSYTSYAMVAGGMAALVSWRAGKHAHARMLSLFFALASLTVNSGGIRTLLAGTFISDPDANWPLWLSLSASFGLAAIVRFTQLFPEPLAPVHVISGGGVRLGALFVRAHVASLRPWLLWGTTTLLALTLVLVQPRFTPLLAALLVMVSASIALANLRAAHRRSDEADRRRLFWVLEAIVVGGAVILLDLVLLLVALVFGMEAPLFAWEAWLLILGLWAGLALLVVAIFYGGALDSALVVRRTAVYGLLTPALVFLFAGVENVVADRVAAWVGLPASLGAWIGGGTVALAFGPFRNLLDRTVGRIGRGPS